MDKAVLPVLPEKRGLRENNYKTVIYKCIPGLTGIIRREPFAGPGSMTRPGNTLNLNKTSQSNTLPIAMCRSSSFRRSHFCR